MTKVGGQVQCRKVLAHATYIHVPFLRVIPLAISTCRFSPLFGSTSCLLRISSTTSASPFWLACMRAVRPLGFFQFTLRSGRRRRSRAISALPTSTADSNGGRPLPPTLFTSVSLEPSRCVILLTSCFVMAEASLFALAASDEHSSGGGYEVQKYLGMQQTSNHTNQKLKAIYASRGTGRHLPFHLTN